MSRLSDGAPLLDNHDPSKQIGVVDGARIQNGKGFATVRFSSTQAGQDVFRDVRDKIKRNVSVGYDPRKMVLVSKSDDKNKVYRVTDWQPMEISIVSMPLDNSVGVGRAEDDAEFDVEIVDSDKIEERKEPANNFMAETTVTETRSTEDPKPIAKPEVDVSKIREQVQAEEIARVTGISALGREFDRKFEKDADKFIKENKTVAQFNDYVLRELAKTATPTPSGSQASSVGTVTIPVQDASRYSLVKAIRESYEAQVKGGKRGGGVSGIEAELSQEVADKTKRNPDGFFIPEFALTRELKELEANRPLSKRDLSTLTQGAGAFTVESSVLGTELVALLRHRMYVMAAGARYLGGLQGNILIPRHVGPGTAFWLAENAGVTESDQSFGQFSLTPHTLMAQTKYSKQLLAQSSIDVEGLVRSDLNYIIAIALDLAALAGSGINGQPFGIYGQQFPGSVGAGDDTHVSTMTWGGTATWANVILLESLIASLDADVDNMCYITTPLARGKWKTNSKVTNFPTFLWEAGAVKWDDGAKGTDVGFVNGYRAFATNQLSAAVAANQPANGAIFGNFNDLLVANWAGIDVVTDPYTAAATGEIVVTIHLMADIGVRRTRSFAVSTDSAAQ